MRDRGGLDTKSVKIFHFKIFPVAVYLKNDGVVVIFLSSKPSRHLVFIDWIHGIDTEGAGDDLLRDAADRAEHGQAVLQLSDDVLDWKLRGDGDYGNSAISLDAGCIRFYILYLLVSSPILYLVVLQQSLLNDFEEEARKLELKGLDESSRNLCHFCVSSSQQGGAAFGAGQRLNDST